MVIQPKIDKFEKIFKDFDIVSGPNQSNSVQYVNGAMSQQMVISYGLAPKKEGKFTIGPSYITSGGQRMETAPVTIEDVKNGANTGGNSGSEADQQSNSKISGGDLFIKTALSKSKCYLGEQITILQKVYSRLQIIGFQKSLNIAYIKSRASPLSAVNSNLNLFSLFSSVFHSES